LSRIKACQMPGIRQQVLDAASAAAHSAAPCFPRAYGCLIHDCSIACIAARLGVRVGESAKQLLKVA
jgi:hypothetical protein